MTNPVSASHVHPAPHIPVPQPELRSPRTASFVDLVVTECSVDFTKLLDRDSDTEASRLKDLRGGNEKGL